MKKVVLKVDGMSCGHCVKAITKALEILSGIHTVEVDLKAKTVTVEHDPALAAIEKIKGEIENLGYEIIAEFL